jgi:hypothetical protein
MSKANKQKILELLCAAKSPEAIATQLNIDIDLVKEVIQNLQPTEYTPARQLFGMN